METLLQKRIPWSQYAGLADPVLSINTGDACVCAKWCRRGDGCCATSMVIAFGNAKGWVISDIRWWCSVGIQSLAEADNALRCSGQQAARQCNTKTSC